MVFYSSLQQKLSNLKPSHHYFCRTTTSLTGIPLHIELVPANTDERVAAEEVLQYVKGCEIIGDKGFIGEQ